MGNKRGITSCRFLEKAGRYYSSSGKKMQVHLRHAMRLPLLSRVTLNELGFWASPKLLLDLRKRQ